MIPKLRLKPKPSSFSPLIFFALFFPPLKKPNNFTFFLLSSPFMEEKKENGVFLFWGLKCMLGGGGLGVGEEEGTERREMGCSLL